MNSVQDIRKGVVVMPDEFGLHEGLVAFFDILGFSHVASDEELVKTAALIQNDFLTIPAQLNVDLAKKYGMRTGLEMILFADTILMWLDIPQNAVTGVVHQDFWHYFLLACSTLMQKMFNRGLPLRGAISNGRFYIKDHCFVGRPIIECQKLEKQQEWSGCVIDPKAWKNFCEIAPRQKQPLKSIMEWVCVQYPVPLKTESKSSEADHCSEHEVIKWFPIHRGKDYVAPNPSVPDLVQRAFTAHGKTLTSKERKKLENTITALKYFESLYLNTNEQITI